MRQDLVGIEARAARLDRHGGRGDHTPPIHPGMIAIQLLASWIGGAPARYRYEVPAA